MIAVTSMWENNNASQNVTRTHRFGLQDDVRCALSETYPVWISYSRTSSIGLPTAFD